jgi:hypothetical protein
MSGPQLAGGSGTDPGPMPPHDTAYSLGSHSSSQAPVAPGHESPSLTQSTVDPLDPGQDRRCADAVHARGSPLSPSSSSGHSHELDSAFESLPPHAPIVPRAHNPSRPAQRNTNLVMNHSRKTPPKNAARPGNTSRLCFLRTWPGSTGEGLRGVLTQSFAVLAPRRSPR